MRSDFTMFFVTVGPVDAVRRLPTKRSSKTIKPKEALSREKQRVLFIVGLIWINAGPINLGLLGNVPA
jgi:hypothetical protein